MDLGVKGFIPVSMLDWDGNLAATIFTGGCNFRCAYCHNPELVLSHKQMQDVDFQLIEKHLIDKRNWLDGVVITGGEPLINPHIKQILKRIKALGYKIKLDTNGSLPEALEELFEKDLVDFVAMDIKTSFPKYKELTKSDSTLNIQKSIKTLIASGIANEFRTTMIPGFVTKDDVLQIANIIKGGDTYFLQQFNSQQVLEPRLKHTIKYPDEMLVELATECSKIIPTKTRGTMVTQQLAC